MRGAAARLDHIRERIVDADMERAVGEYRAKGIRVTRTGLLLNGVHYYLDTEPKMVRVYPPE